MFKITAHIKSRFLNLIGGIFLFCFVVLLCLTAKKNLAQFFGRILMRLIILVCWAGTISLRALCPKIPRKRALAPFLVVSSHTISKFSSLRCILHLSCDHLTNRHHWIFHTSQIFKKLMLAVLCVDKVPPPVQWLLRIVTWNKDIYYLASIFFPKGFCILVSGGIYVCNKRWEQATRASAWLFMRAQLLV